ncbi:MAG: ATP-dependent helicase [bacterium]|nr:ATP-dependent helicase [bacterium]
MLYVFACRHTQYQCEIQEIFEQCSAAGIDEHQQALQVFNGKDVSIARMKELAQAFPAENLHDAIRQFLDRATVYATRDDIRGVNAVNLFTIHSSKGLEHPVVFVSGVEKGSPPASIPSAKKVN